MSTEQLLTVRNPIEIKRCIEALWSQWNWHPDLLSTLQSNDCSGLMKFFASLPTNASAREWGIYKVGTAKGARSLPGLYTGSATSRKAGLRERFTRYDRFISKYNPDIHSNPAQSFSQIPQLIIKDATAGSKITFRSILANIGLPSESDDLPFSILRLHVKAMEATVQSIFGTIPLASKVPNLCLWNRSDLPYRRLCTKSALRDGRKERLRREDRELSLLTPSALRNGRQDVRGP